MENSSLRILIFCLSLHASHLLTAIAMQMQGQLDLPCQMPPMSGCDENINNLSREDPRKRIILFPNVRFKCSATLNNMLVFDQANTEAQGATPGVDNQGIIMTNLQVQLWRMQKQTQRSYVLRYKVSIPSNSCTTVRKLDNGNTRINCMLPEKVNVKEGDILGIILPSNGTKSEINLCFKTLRPPNRNKARCARIFNYSNSIPNQTTLTLPDSKCMEPQNRLRPQIGTCIQVDGEDQLMSCTSDEDPTQDTSDHPPRPSDLLSVSGPVVAVLLVIIIVLIVVGFILFYRRKKHNSLNLSSSPSRNSTYPNPIYNVNNHNNMEGGEQSVSFANADYDEISDESPTKKKVPTGSETALERSTPGNNYFTLTPTEEEEEKDGGKDGQAQTVAANYEVFIPTQDHSGESFDEKPSAMFDIDDTYWEPADSINELYKQLSSDKYRDISPQQVDLSEVLGSGEFGTVNKGTWQSPVGAMEVAVKQLQPGASEEEKVKFLQEAAINGQFRHPNVVKLMGVVTTGETTMIVLELLSKGDLRSFLLKLRQSSVEVPKVSVDQQCLLKFCQQIASGMEYLSNKAFVHRDLAARNILVSGDQVCKISDFGMSRNLMDEDYYVSHGGRIPVKWTAPEAINYKKYSSASDVWSFGCVMYEIWSLGHKPFESHSNPEVIKIVDKGYRLPPPPGLSKELYKIMMQCWQPKTTHRPTFTQLVEMLSRADFELFVWKEEDLKDTHPQVKDIGAPLEAAENIYLDIQNMYK